MNRSYKLLFLALAAMPCAAAADEQTICKVALTQDPLVMRLGKDEFRIAFGLDGTGCHEAGCTGLIKYRATWETEDGTRRTENKLVSFDIPNGAERSLTVSRNYFDTREAQHTTEIVSVEVASISCDVTPQVLVDR